MSSILIDKKFTPKKEEGKATFTPNIKSKPSAGRVVISTNYRDTLKLQRIK